MILTLFIILAVCALVTSIMALGGKIAAGVPLIVLSIIECLRCLPLR